LARIGGEDYAREEMAGITATKQDKQDSFRDLFSPGVRMALIVAVLLGLFNNLTGWTPISSYLAALFMKAGFEKTEAILRFVLVYGLMGVLSFLPMLLADKVGRRPLWIWSSAMMAAALVFVFAVFHYNMSGMWVLVAVALTVLPHAIALGGIPWLVMSELFPGNLRTKGVALATTVLWMANFGGGFVFPLITEYSENHYGNVGPAFLVFAFISVLSVIFGLTLLPETKGKSLEDMGKSWKLEKDMPPPQ
jgi:SP family arabinose:H+ symporter-like MFS transporter